MANYYCFDCSIDLGLLSLPDLSEITGLSATPFQKGKYTKHTLPSVSPKLTSVLNEPDYPTYKSLTQEAAQKGFVQVDDKRRVNIIWPSGSNIATSWRSGASIAPLDSVKYVQHDQKDKRHPFFVDSASLSGTTCDKCGNLLVE